MKKFTYSHLFFLFLFLTSVLTNCEKKDNLDIPQEEQKLTVLCNFSPDQPFSIELSTSKSIIPGENNTTKIENAVIEICRGNDLMEKIPEVSNSGNQARFLSMESVATTNEVYTLKIKADGLPPITATSSIPAAVPLEHVALGEFNEILNQDNNKEYEAKIALQFFDPVGEKNFYQINFYQEFSNQSLQDSSVQLIPNLNFNSFDESIERTINLIDGGVLIKDFTFDGTLKEFLFEPVFEKFSTSTPKNIVVELRSVSEEYYQFYSSLYRQLSQVSSGGTEVFNENVPFSDPTIISSNIENGFGVFAGYSKNTFNIPTGL